MFGKEYFASGVFGKLIFQKIINYLDKDPRKNLPRVLELVAKGPIKASHRREIHALREALDSNTNLQQYVERFFSQTDKNVQRIMPVNFFLNAYLAGPVTQRRLTEELGYGVPSIILFDPTSRCNLRCKGCWAGEYPRHDSFSFDEADRLMTEAKELGIYFIAVSGGEPFMWPHLVELCRKHNDMAFMIYTNGTLIDETMAEQMRQAGNMSPAISIEGDREATDDRRGKDVFDKIMLAMDHLRAKGVIFGASCTVTRNNIDTLFSDEFIDLLIEKGALYVWSFHYIPIGSHPDFDMMITPGQRENLVHRVRYLRSHKPIQIADFWNDGHIVGGCIAGGRRYIHIDAAGWAEPCAFVHFANVNFKRKSLKEVLQSPIFKAYQKRQPFNANMLCPCPIIDNPTMLRDIVAESGAMPTHQGAETVLKGELAANLDTLAAEWGERADALAEADHGATVK